MRSGPKILIAGVGNVLRRDDAFGVEFIRELETRNNLSTNIKLMEVGIGGIHLVQELYGGYDILILADAVEYGGAPGDVYLREMESIGDIEKMEINEKRTFLADMHYTNPVRALMLAKAMKVLPKQVMIVGCEALEHEDFGIGMSEPVINAIPIAVGKIEKWLKDNDLLSN